MQMSPTVDVDAAHCPRSQPPSALSVQRRLSMFETHSSSSSERDATDSKPVKFSAIAAAASAQAVRHRRAASAVQHYDYDQARDDDEQARQRALAQSRSDARQRESKYIPKLVQAAEQRKLEAERAAERRIMRQRHDEQTQFADKEQFVTRAYKRALKQRDLQQPHDNVLSTSHHADRADAQQATSPTRRHSSTADALKRPRAAPRAPARPVARPDYPQQSLVHPASPSAAQKQPLRGLRRNDEMSIEAYRQRYFARRAARVAQRNL